MRLSGRERVWISLEKVIEKGHLESKELKLSLVGCRLWGHTELDTTEAT